MELPREELIEHLERVHVGGEISEAVFQPDLSVSALSSDGLFVVDVPAGADEDVLPEPTGFIDLDLVIKALSMGQDPDAELQIMPSSGLLEIGAGDAGRGRFITADPPTIGTYVEQETRDRVIEGIRTVDGIPVGRNVVTGVTEWQRTLDAQEAHLKCEPDGSTFLIGVDTNHVGEVPVPQLQTDEDEYTLILPATRLVRVLDLITQPDEARLTITGEDSNVGISFDGHTYVFEPMASSQ